MAARGRLTTRGGGACRRLCYLDSFCERIPVSPVVFPCLFPGALGGGVSCLDLSSQINEQSCPVCFGSLASLWVLCDSWSLGHASSLAGVAPEG